MTNFPCWAHQTVLKFVFTHLLEWSIFACQIDPWCGKLDPGTSCRSNDAYKANIGQTGKTKCFDKTDHQPLPCGTLYALSTLVPQINCPVTMHQCLYAGATCLCVRHAKRHPGISNPHQYAAPEDMRLPGAHWLHRSRFWKRSSRDPRFSWPVSIKCEMGFKIVSSVAASWPQIRWMQGLSDARLWWYHSMILSPYMRSACRDVPELG